MAHPHLDLSRSPLSPHPPPRSQLTIFYSGSVNVFDDVPADKAHAIMLLLHSDTLQHCPGDNPRLSPSHSVMSPINPSDSPSCDAPASAVVSRPSSASFRELLQPLSRSSTPPPPSPYPGLQADKKQQIICKRSQAELPFARKASLARFLEKRKDRLQVKVEDEPQDVAGSSEKRIKLPTDEETTAR